MQMVCATIRRFPTGLVCRGPQSHYILVRSTVAYDYIVGGAVFTIRILTCIALLVSK